jgi:glycosyltransferase involved in cell wall biosynthesis
MKLLHVLPAYWPAVRYGGPVFAVHGLCRELAVRGHDVEVMTTNVDGPGDSDVPLQRPVWRDGVKINYFASPLARRIFYAPAMVRALDATVTSFDIVHLHTLYQWPTFAAARAAQRAHVPYLVSPRGMLVEDLIRRRSRLAKMLWLGLLERRNLARATALHATSEVEAEEIGRFGWKLPPVVTVGNGVDEPENFAAQDVAPDVKAATADGSIVLCLGRLSWKKGLDRLLRAFARVPDSTLVIAGTDDEGLSAGLAALARELGIAPRVRILPRTVLGADKEHLFAAAQVFALASYSENFGNAVLEAMRRGVAVVTTPEVGAAQIVREAGGGAVADGEAFAEALAQLIADPVLARAMGEAGRRFVIAHYGWPAIAARTEALYADLIAQRRAVR